MDQFYRIVIETPGEACELCSSHETIKEAARVAFNMAATLSVNASDQHARAVSVYKGEALQISVYVKSGEDLAGRRPL